MLWRSTPPGSQRRRIVSTWTPAQSTAIDAKSAPSCAGASLKAANGCRNGSMALPRSAGRMLRIGCVWIALSSGAEAQEVRRETGVNKP